MVKNITGSKKTMATKGDKNMKKELVIRKTSDLEKFFSGDDTGVIVEKVGNSLLLMPQVDENTWLPLSVRVEKGEVVVSADQAIDDKPFYVKLLDGSYETLPKRYFDPEKLQTLLDRDPQALFKIMELLDIFDRQVDGTKKRLIQVLLDLTNGGASLEMLFMQLSTLTREELLNFIFGPKETLILRYRKLFGSVVEDDYK